MPHLRCFLGLTLCQALCDLHGIFFHGIKITIFQPELNFHQEEKELHGAQYSEQKCVELRVCWCEEKSLLFPFTVNGHVVMEQ